jgi:hypothetical protein
VAVRVRGDANRDPLDAIDTLQAFHTAELARP